MNSFRINQCCLFCFIGIFVCFLRTGPLQGQPVQQASEVEKFFTAIQENDTNTATAMLAGNTNLAFAGENFSKLPLLEAAAAGNLALVKRLVELGADINAQGDTRMSGGSQMTALHEAISHNQPAVAEYLLTAGANPNLMAFGFMTPLHLAFSKDREEIAGWLLDYGANPFQGKLFSNDETTPFELAITQGDGTLIPRMLGQESTQPLGIKSLQKPRHSKSLPRGVKTVSEILAAHGNALLVVAAQRGELEAVQSLLLAGVTATNASPDGHSLLQSFAIANAEAAGNRPSVMNQLRQVQSTLNADYIPTASPQFVASLRSQETELNAKIKMLDPERRQKILELLIQHGAGYDAFAATALADTNQMQRLLSADKNVPQSRAVDGQTPLHWAVKTGQLPLFQFWITAGVPLDATDSAGKTALHLAAAAGKTELIETLLAAHAHTDFRDTNGWTPLDAAIHARQAGSIHLLLGEKSAPAHPERGYTITLHQAAATGNIAALAALVETETNLEARNELGLTPLQLAVTKGHLAAAALLVDKGADVNVRDPDGNSLLHLIFLQPQFTVYDRPPTNWLAHPGKNPPLAAYVQYLTVGQYEQGPNPVLQGTAFLLACGLEAGATNHTGQTVMQLINDNKISRGVFFFDDDREKLFKLLGGAGGNIDQRDAAGNTALHLAGQDTVADRVAALIAGGSDINATNYQGQTPLHKYAARIWGWGSGEPPNEPFQLLLYHHPNVNAQDNEGLTPLDVLAMSDTSFRAEATGALLAAGANPNLRDKQGRTAVDFFLSGKWPWEEAARCIPMLLKSGADLSVQDNEGKTPLHYLATLGSQQPMFFISGIGDIFLTAKVNLEARDHDGNTPLLLAAKSGTADVFTWLVKQGADLDATNNAGQTPRVLAAQNNANFWPRSVIPVRPH